MTTAAAPALSKQRSGAGQQIPSLNGLRAISVVLVIVGHLSRTNGVPRLDFGIGDYANLGVIVFFVISGFLITSLLLAEHEANGRVSLKLFYARRTIRIFPAAFAYIGVVGLLSAAGLIETAAREYWHAVTYTVNYMPGGSWYFRHLWSLGVEEQFYLFWPFAFTTLGPRRSRWAIAAVLAIGPAARLASGFLLRGTPYVDLRMFPMVGDCLAAGCLLASLRPWLESRQWYLRLFHPAYSAGLLATVLLLNRYLEHTPVRVLGQSVMNLALAVLIHRSVYRSGDAVGAILNWKPLAQIGVLSYSFYLWQQLFLNRSSEAWFAAFPQNLGLAIAAGCLSYVVVEKPLLSLRHRLRTMPAGK